MLRAAVIGRAQLLVTPRAGFASISSHDDLINYRATNEPVMQFLPGSKEVTELEAALEKWKSKVTDIPLIIGDKEIRNKNQMKQVCPFDKNKTISTFYYAEGNEIQQAIDGSLKARKAWEALPHHKRADIFIKMADLCAGKYRADLLATTMLGQAKTIIQAEIDAGPELIDFCRFNVQFLGEILKYQPISSGPSENRFYLRGMEGFWAAITPFNFTAIGGHLALAPALMGNVVLWKPSDTAMLSNYLCYQIMREAGVPGNIIQFTPADGPTFGRVITDSRHLCGVNFTGSVPTFRFIWDEVSKRLDHYKTFPRLIGELGGKNFHFVHKSADARSVAIGTILSGFEFGGQKCSACSRAYVPKSLWPEVKDVLTKEISQLKLGSPLEKDTFLSAVIDDKSFERIKSYIDHAKSSSDCEIVAGGKYDDSKGFFIEPTIVKTSDPKQKLMSEEIFGPVVTVYVYDDDDWEKTLDLVEGTSPYALTGSIFAQDQAVVERASARLRDCVGNMYVNDKSTGSVVGQQPFGGARRSGTNDKAGGPHYMLKFASPITVKTTKEPLNDWRYPYMGKV